MLDGLLTVQARDVFRRLRAIDSGIGYVRYITVDDGQLAVTDGDSKAVRDPVYRHLYFARTTSVNVSGAPTGVRSTAAPDRSRQTETAERPPGGGKVRLRDDVALRQTRAADNELAAKSRRAAQTSPDTTGPRLHYEQVNESRIIA